MVVTNPDKCCLQICNVQRNLATLHHDRESDGKGAGFDTILGLSTTKPPRKLPAKLNQLARLTMNHLAASENSVRSSVVTGNNRCGTVERGYYITTSQLYSRDRI